MKKTMIFVAFLSLSAFLAFQPVFSQGDLTYGLNATAGAAKLNQGLGQSNDIQSFIGTIIGTALSFVGIIFFILMLYGGFLWMTARGNEDQTSRAIGTITAGAIGMVIIMASYTITSFLFTSLALQDPSRPPAATMPAMPPVPGAGGGTASGGVRCCVYRDRGNSNVNAGRWVAEASASQDCQAICDSSNGLLWGCADISIPNQSGAVGGVCR